MAKQPITPEQVHGKYAGGPKAATRLERDLNDLEEQGYDIGDSLGLLEEFTSLDREDYEDAEEFSDARDEAWDAIMDAIEDIEDLETEDEETTTVTTKTATAKTVVASKPVAKAPAKQNPVKAAVAKATGRTRVPSKACRTCGITKPLTDFRNKASRPDGVDTNCRACSIVWLANNKAKKAAAVKPVVKRTTAAKRDTSTAKPVATKSVAKPVAKPVSTREAAARAKDATPRTRAVAK
jgi:hypothetical protein